MTARHATALAEPAHKRLFGPARRLAAACTVASVVAVSGVATAFAQQQPQTVAPSAPSRVATSAASPGPSALAARSANEPYAHQIVTSIAGTGDNTAAATMAASLDNGTSPTAAARAFARTAAGLTPPINDAYHSMLGRSPDAGGKAHWVVGVQRGHTSEWIIAALANSAEFRARYATPTTRVGAIYRAVLGRSADPGGAAYYTAMISRGATYGQVVFHLAHSREYGNVLVRELYPLTLFRHAPASGVPYWRDQVAKGRIGRIDLIGQLAGSAEAQQFGCDPIAGGDCMLPWPNNAYTRADDTTSTGVRMNLRASYLPKNASGVAIDPVQPNRSDGFSPGSTGMVQIPGIDVAASQLPTIDNLDRNGASAPILLVDLDTNEQVPVWAELDVHDTYANPAQQPLLIHPTKNLTDGHHYAFVLRNLKDTGGATIASPPVFDAIRSGREVNVAGFAQRAQALTPVLETLQTNSGVNLDDVYLAWDFTVASTENLTGRLIHMRDDAFSQLGDAAPDFTVTRAVDDQTPGIARVVEGTFQVPNYLTGTGAPGETFNEDATGLPQRNGMFTATFRCVIPDSALTTPARISLYGHGLFGTLNEVTAGNVKAMASEHNMVFCGTLWSGMSADDLQSAAKILQDLSGFAKLADRNQQGVLNFLFLGRLMKHAQGLSSNAAFQNDAHASVLDTSELFYDGNSQGGIQGGMATAVAQDWTRAVLGVPGINYSMLLPRSTDFNTFEMVMRPAYPNEFDRLRGLAVVQLEWDRGEANGYANHMTDNPLPGTPTHTVLLHVALGDHQVSDFAADTEARTIGAKTNCPSFAPDRVPGTMLLWNVPCIESYPYNGSAIVYFDSGAELPLLTNTSPTTGHDPHSDPRSDPAARNQKSAFLRTDGSVIDVCDNSPCTAAQD